MSLWLLLIAHLVADFTLQSADLAVKKTQHFRYLAGHGAMYALTVGAVALVSMSGAIVWASFAVIALTHFLVDWIRIWVDKKLKLPEKLFVSFVFDQLIHVAIIWACVWGFGLDAHLRPWLAELLSGESAGQILRYALIFVIILDPASVFVKKLSEIVPVGTGAQKQEDDSASGKTGDGKQNGSVGDVIGKLERILTVILVLSNEIRAIGFVLTAKSLARSKQFNEDGFAERYLIGTLASNAIAIIAAVMLK